MRGYTSGHNKHREGIPGVVKAYYLLLNNTTNVTVLRTMCHVGTKTVRSFVVPTFELHLGLTLTESLRPNSHGSIRRGMSDGKKLSMQSTSCTPTPRR